MTSVTSLLETPFLTRDQTQQLEIIELGRPLPSLKLACLQIVNDKTVVHTFKAEIYKKKDWLCGCSNLNAFFCFPCTLFGGDDSWSTSGFKNILLLDNAISKHELSPVHMSNVINYSKLMNKPTILQTHSVEKENKRIEKNLQVLEAIVECIRFSACNSIPLSKQTEDKDTNDGDPLEDLLLLITSSNSTCRNYLQQEPFKDLESMKNDILKVAAEVIREEIIKEIDQANFVSIIVHSGDSDFPRIIVFRYVKGSEPIERVWKLIRYDNMNDFAEILLTELRTFIKKPNMLISQSYDEFVELHEKVKTYYPQANLVHFYSHDFLDIISNVASIRKQFPYFIGMVCGICQLMTCELWTAKVKTTFEDVQKRFHKDMNGIDSFDFVNKRIESVFQQRQALEELMSIILENFQDYPDNLLFQASNFRNMLEAELNKTMLKTFFKMTPAYSQCIYEYENCLNPTYYSEPEKIRTIINSPATSSQFIQLNIGSVNREIEVKIETDIEVHDIDLSQVKIEIPETENIDLYLPSTSKRKFDEVNEEHDRKNERAVEAAQSVMTELHERLKYRTNMFASQLVDPRNFIKFSLNFPGHILTAAVGALPIFSAFDSLKLRTELGVLYAQEDYQSLASSCDVLKQILDNNLASTFSETVKLLQIVLTMPSRTDDSKRCFKTREKVQQFLDDSRWFNDVDCLVYFRCERSFVEDMNEFNSKVIKKFLEISKEAKHFQRLPLEQ